MDRRRLIIVQFLVLGAALVAAATAPSAAMLLLASLLLGSCSSVAQQIVPFAASLATPERRGSAIGTVMGGLLCGILLSRALAGFLAEHFGWAHHLLGRAAAGAAGRRHDGRRPAADHAACQDRLWRRPALARRLWREEPALRQATYRQSALFAGFISFWTILALHLEEPRFGLGADIAGLFGVIGAAGILAAPLAGRLADRRGPHLVITLGAATALASWVIFGLWDSLPG